MKFAIILSSDFLENCVKRSGKAGAGRAARMPEQAHAAFPLDHQARNS